MEKYDEGDLFYEKYKVIILAAMMMLVGANLDEDMKGFIQKTLPTVSTSPFK
jgi:hypothetical protein